MKFFVILVVLISNQALSTNATATDNCICATSLSKDLLEIFYEHTIDMTITTDSDQNIAQLGKSYDKILNRINGLENSLHEVKGDINSQLFDLRLTLQVELGKVFLLVQDLALLNPSIIGTVDVNINEISLRLLTLISSCKIAMQECTDQNSNSLKNLDNAFINVSESFASLIDYVYNLTYGESRTSSLVVNLEEVLKIILFSIHGSVSICKELIIHAKITISSTILVLCKNLEIACNSIKQGESVIDVNVNLALELDIDVDMNILKPIFSIAVDHTANNTNVLRHIFKINRVSNSSIEMLESNAKRFLLALQNIYDAFKSLTMAKSYDFNMLVSVTNLLKSLNSLSEYVTKMHTQISVGATKHLKDFSNDFRNILLDVTANYESLLDAVFRTSMTYIIDVFKTTDLSKYDDLSNQLTAIQENLGAVASSLHILAKSVFTVIEITLRSSVVIMRTKTRKCLTSLNGLTTDISTMLDNLDEVNFYNVIYRLNFGSGPRAIGPLSVCSSRIAIILVNTRVYLIKLNNAMDVLKRQVSCE